MRFPRGSGILLHPTSLPGEFGTGDIGPEAFRFIDQLKTAGQAYWQILPLGPTGYGDSPYQSPSAFAGNPLLISPKELVADGLLAEADIENIPNFPTDRADFTAVAKWKNEILSTAFRRFTKTSDTQLREKFARFCERHSEWLNDYALYRAIKSSQHGKAWFDWPAKFKLRDERTINIATEQLADLVEAEKFIQFLFFRQWMKLKAHCNELGIRIIGDIPIFVALDSADVWCHQHQFKLDKDGSPTVLSGVPPDYFSKTGQLWGNPIYDWDAMQRDGFHWWKSRVRATLSMVDIARIDHFRGFISAWEVPGKDKTAENGEWVNAPGQKLFEALQADLGELPLIAEDLGVITPEVTGLRDRFGLPGMRILQFAFGGDSKNHDLPHNYVQNSVAYTGTHDNDTTIGWWRSVSGDGSTRDNNAITHEHEFCLKYLKSDGSEINWDFIRAIWSSVANIAIAPLQDVLGLGNEARMNLPATANGNWSWRLRENALTDDFLERLRDLTEIYSR